MSDPTIITAIRSVATAGGEVLAAFKLSNGQGIIANSDGLHLHETDISVSWYEVLEFLKMHQTTFISGEFKPAPRTGDSSLDVWKDSIGDGALEPYDGSWICPDCGVKHAAEVKFCKDCAVRLGAESLGLDGDKL